MLLTNVDIGERETGKATLHTFRAHWAAQSLDYMRENIVCYTVSKKTSEEVRIVTSLILAFLRRNLVFVTK